MAVLHHVLTIRCEECDRRFVAERRTVVGARGDAARKGWLIPRTKTGAASAIADARDVCPLHRELPPPSADQLF